MSKNKPTFKLWEVILIAAMASLIMSLATGYVTHLNRKEIDCSAGVDDPEIANFINAYNSLLANFLEKVNKEDLIEAAIDGMVTYLDDPYTTYLNEHSKDFLIDGLKGTYEGIGIEVSQRETGEILIVNVFVETPAAKAGLKIGDILVKINGESFVDKTANDAVNIIKRNKTVNIEVERDGEFLEFNLSRQDVYLPVVLPLIFERNNKKIGYIGISKFSESVAAQFKQHLEHLEKEGIDSLIIDVRDNTGGYLNGAKDIAEMFLKEKQTIYSLKTKLKTTNYKDETKEERSYPVAVIINENSASASEILAGALKYNNKAILVGIKSFGKGKVQQTSNLTDGSMIKYTTAEWLLPNGDGIDGKGLNPDIIVSLSEEYLENRTIETDNQLQVTLEELSK